MPYNCAAVVLCGGRNSRMQARNKAFLTIDGRRFLDRILDVLRPRFSEILLVAKTPAIYAEYDLKIATDRFAVFSTLAGIHAGLSNINSDHAFCVGCDTPFLNPGVIDILLEGVDRKTDIVLPTSGSYFQPLCAVYSKNCAELIETHLSRKILQVNQLFPKLRLKQIPYDRFRKADPDLLSFFNVNTPQDLAQVIKLSKKRFDR